MVKDIDALVSWLRQHHIDTNLWGKGSIKSVAHLWSEITAGETVLLDDPPCRVVHVVQVVIRRGQQVLLEAEQIMQNGSHRSRNQPPSEKFKLGESYLEVAIRCLEEELGVAPHDIKLYPESYEIHQALQDARSYPGLLTAYTIHRIDAEVSGLPDEPFYRDNEAVLTGDPVKQHLWAWGDGSKLA